jgi:hypothetical protein
LVQHLLALLHGIVDTDRFDTGHGAGDYLVERFRIECLLGWWGASRRVSGFTGGFLSSDGGFLMPRLLNDGFEIEVEADFHFLVFDLCCDSGGDVQQVRMGVQEECLVSCDFVGILIGADYGLIVKKQS